MIPTEPIGSIPRPIELIEALKAFQADHISKSEIEARYDQLVRDTISRFEQTGSPVVTDGEQTKPSFATYPLSGAANVAPDGVRILFADRHTRRLPRLTAGPFRYQVYADSFLETALMYAHVPVKQAVISASALSLIYPAEGIAGYPREAFIEELVREHETDIRRCLEKGAYKVQVDFTEARLSLKLDPSGRLLRTFIELNNRALQRFSLQDRQRIGVHTCPGGNCDSTHSADVDYAALLPELFELEAGGFYIALAGEWDRPRVLKLIRQFLKPHQRAFVGVTDPINPRIETPEEVRDRVLEAAEYIPIKQLGTTDDCGFAPFADDTSTSRETAFAKIRSRVEGTVLAAKALGVG